VRLRRARLLHKPNPYHFSSCALDFPVVTHSPRKRDRVFVPQIHWRSFRSRNLINTGKLELPAPNADKDLNFAVPSLGGEPSDRPVRSGILPINASTAQISEFR
jgi:hypothetical protein